MVTLVYSTCSLEPEENEQVVRLVLGRAVGPAPLWKRSVRFPFETVSMALLQRNLFEAHSISRLRPASAGGMIRAYARRPI